MKRVLASLAWLAAAGAAQGAQSASGIALGRLFFTPAERAQLDIARLQKKPPPTAAASAAPATVPAPQVVTYGGIVRRSDGRSTLWINNRPVDAREALSGSSLKGRVRPDGAVTLQVPETGGTIDVKVGQSVELQSGRVAEARKPPPEVPPAKETAAPPEAKSADAKPVAETRAPAKASAPGTAAPPVSDKSGNGMGLKMDLGSRTLEPAETQRLSGGSAR